MQKIIPVVIGGDIGAYALGREAHEAFGEKAICVASSPIAAITHSRIFTLRSIERTTNTHLITALKDIAASFKGAALLILTNNDSAIDILWEIYDHLPDNTLIPNPTPEVISTIAHKDQFINLCQKFGLPVPKTEVVCLESSAPPTPTSLTFPVVAKPSYSPEYAPYLAQGFKKVYYIASQEELDHLWTSLQSAGFTKTFLVQELIPGNDTYLGSMTVYLTQNAEPTLFAAAQVLLNDHAPTMLGNPVAMITHSVPKEWKRAAAMLATLGYHGFANFDVKRNPKTNETVFIEVNPRIGRNSYYVTAAGENPLAVCTDDLVYNVVREPVTVTDNILYTLIPHSLLRRYLTDPNLRKKVDELIREHKTVNPLYNPCDRVWRRKIAVALTKYNHVRKFAQYYPRPTETSF